MPTALITGITGQDGSYLAEMLLEKGYTVYGLARRESWFRQNNASHLRNSIQVLFGDMAEGVDLATAVQDARPDEIYNLAAQSRPGESWARSSETLVINGLAAIRLFEAVRHVRPECRVYHASSSEMFANRPKRAVGIWAASGSWPASKASSTDTERSPDDRRCSPTGASPPATRC